MPETFSSSRLPLYALVRPHCPKCDAQMTLARGLSAFDIRTFEYDRCDHTHIAPVATDPMKSDQAGWLLASDLRAPT